MSFDRQQNSCTGRQGAKFSECILLYTKQLLCQFFDEEKCEISLPYKLIYMQYVYSIGFNRVKYQFCFCILIQAGIGICMLYSKTYANKRAKCLYQCDICLLNHFPPSIYHCYHS